MNMQAAITLRAVIFLIGVVPYWIGPVLMNVLGRNPIKRGMTGSQMAGMDNPLVVLFWVLFAFWFFVWPFIACHRHAKRHQQFLNLANKSID